MKKIKYKAWDYENEIMYNSQDIGIKPLSDRTSDLTISSEGIFIRPDNKNFELLLFTGLYDKEGTEIYEGEFIETPDGILEVCFTDGCFMVTSLGGMYVVVDLLIAYANDLRENLCMIVGNKFENPELLK